ncbi:MAG: acylneuraminate cytidylyltransferase [Elusimicrobia bacterium]|nr:acylneuraminate cytidylyltransferase [Elusimicrobiota bacterium]
MSTQYKIAAIIPARGGSKGIPRKNIINFAGKPLLAWSVEQAKLSKFISDIYVTSDSKEILEIAHNYGAKTILRPKNISGDTASSESALLHALRQMEERPDYIVFLQTTALLRKPDDIDNAIKKIIKDKSDSLLSLTEAYEFIWKKTGNKFTSLSFDSKDRKRRQDLSPVYYENGSIYIFKPEILEKHGNRLGGKVSIYTMKSWQRVDIDDYETLKLAELVFLKNLAKKVDKNILSGIELIVYDFDGVMTDNKVTVSQFGNESVKVNRADGLAVSKIKSMGIKQMILSTEKNPVVKKRADKLGITCLYGKNNKKEVLKKYLDNNNISKEKVIFVGNDINDMEVMDYVGYPVAPNDAHEQIKKIAKIITKSKGGDGVVRELLDFLSK